MNNDIYLPKRINVGYQNRAGTYTGKLAYVIYYDERGKLRKETSWNGWRDKDIPNEEFDNEPMEGFVLNKKAGDYSGYWGNHRQAYCRVYDPRGFEIEITINNLLWILENANCIKGKGLEGEFIYGWEGKDLLLVPVDSPDYKRMKEKADTRNNAEFIKAKDLVVGNTYETLKGEKYVFMGKFKSYTEEYNYHKSYYYCYDNNYITGYSYKEDDTWHKDVKNGEIQHPTLYRCVESKNNEFFFIKLGDKTSSYSWERNNNLIVLKSISRKFYKIASEDKSNYPEYLRMLNESSSYSPRDYERDKVIPLPIEQFAKIYNEGLERSYWKSFELTVPVRNEYYERKNYRIEEDGRISIYDRNCNNVLYTFEDAYKVIRPVYIERYLKNGHMWREGYGPEE